MPKWNVFRNQRIPKMEKILKMFKCTEIWYFLKIENLLESEVGNSKSSRIKVIDLQTKQEVEVCKFWIQKFLYQIDP